MSWRFYCILVKTAKMFDKEPVLKKEIALTTSGRKSVKVFLERRTNHNQFLATFLKYTGGT